MAMWMPNGDQRSSQCGGGAEVNEPASTTPKLSRPARPNPRDSLIAQVNDAPQCRFMPRLTPRLSCGARAQPCIRRRPPARRQLQPVVRLHSSLLPLLTWPPADLVPFFVSVPGLATVRSHPLPPARSLRLVTHRNLSDSGRRFERCRVAPG